MNTEKILKLQLDKLDELNEQDKKRIYLIINDFKEKIYYEYKTLNLNTTSLRKIVDEELEKNIFNILIEANNNFHEQSKNLLSLTKEIIDLSNKNKLLHDEIDLKIKKVFVEKINNINIIDNDFQKLYKKNIDMFIYNISIENNLKNKPIAYTSVVKYMNESKKDLINEYIKILNNKKKMISALFIYYDEYIEKENKEKEKIKQSNQIIIKEYALSLLEDEEHKNIDKNLKNVYKYIDTTLNKMHEETIKIKKLKDSKANEEILKELKEYLYSYNNTLYDKSLISIKRMNNIINYNSEVTTEKLKNYNDSVYKIFNLKFNFDKPFEKYKNKILRKKSITTTDTVIEDIKQLIYNYKENITEEIRNNLTTSFKENMDIINNITIKTISIKTKCNNLYIKLNKTILKEMYKK